MCRVFDRTSTIQCSIKVWLLKKVEDYISDWFAVVYMAKGATCSSNSIVWCGARMVCNQKKLHRTLVTWLCPSQNQFVHVPAIVRLLGCWSRIVLHICCFSPPPAPPKKILIPAPLTNVTTTLSTL